MQGCAGSADCRPDSRRSAAVGAARHDADGRAAVQREDAVEQRVHLARALSQQWGGRATQSCCIAPRPAETTRS